MNTNIEHTYGFYLISQYRIRQQMTANRTAYYYASESNDKNTKLLNLLSKYRSDRQTSDNIAQTVDNLGTTIERLNYDYTKLQYEYDTLKSKLAESRDIADQAYNIAYATKDSAPTASAKCTKNIIPQIIKYFMERIK